MIEPIFVWLTPEREAYGEHVGTGRRLTAIANGAVHTNNWRPSDAKAMWKNRHGARCELAGKLWLDPITWNEYQVGGADLGDFIDVKGVELPHHRLLVPRDAKDNYAYLLIDDWQRPKYAIIGWVWGKEGKTHPIESLEGEDRPCHVVRRACPPLLPPQALYDEVRAREMALAAKTAASGLPRGFKRLQF